MTIQTDLSEEELVNQIGSYEGLIVRSQTRVTEKSSSASQLKVIARAGVGVDNIDIDAATLKGILVINAPDGNTISATEHSIAMILEWPVIFLKRINHFVIKNGIVKAFRGIELYGKTRCHWCWTYRFRCCETRSKFRYEDFSI